MKGHIIYLGLSGFPFGLAAIQRQKLLSKSLIVNGWDVTIVCSRSVHNKEIIIDKEGEFEGIKYVYIYSPYRDSSFFIRNFKRLVSPIIEFYVLLKLNQENKINVAIVSNANSFLSAVRYWLYSKVLGFATVLNLVEIYRSRKGAHILSRLNNVFFNAFGLYFYRAYLPISKKLIESFAKFNKRHHYLPVIVDINKVNSGKCEDGTY